MATAQRATKSTMMVMARRATMTTMTMMTTTTMTATARRKGDDPMEGGRGVQFVPLAILAFSAVTGPLKVCPPPKLGLG